MDQDLTREVLVSTIASVLWQVQHYLSVLFSYQKKLSFVFRATRRWGRHVTKLERRFRSRVNYQRKRRGPQRATRRGGHIVECVDPNEFYFRTGIWEDRFFSIHNAIQKYLSPSHALRCPRSVSLNSEFRVLMLFHWLRNYPTVRDLATIYDVSPAYVSRDLNRLLPILYCVLASPKFNVIGKVWQPFPQFSKVAGAGRVAGAIDCTSHYRDRVHPGQALYYRGDKHAHFLTAQVSFSFLLSSTLPSLTLGKIVCALDGRIVSVHIARGHNNDQGMYIITGMKQLLEKKNVYLLADRGYSHVRCVTPITISPEYQEEHAAYRAIVENLNSLTSLWGVAANRCRQRPEIQEIALMSTWYLTALFVSSSTYPPTIQHQ